jgi:dynein heavy chain
MVVFKAVREDKLAFKMRDFVEYELGNSFAYPLPSSMDQVFKDSDFRTPIIFVLSAGAEPTEMFNRFANKMGKTDPRIISLG